MDVKVERHGAFRMALLGWQGNDGDVQCPKVEGTLRVAGRGFRRRRTPRMPASNRIAVAHDGRTRHLACPYISQAGRVGMERRVSLVGASDEGGRPRVPASNRIAVAHDGRTRHLACPYISQAGRVGMERRVSLV